MRIEEARDGDTFVLRLAGRLDREWADHLSGTLSSLLQDGARSLVLDLGGVTYVSSAIASVLQHWREELAMLRGQLRVVSVSASVQEMFKLSGWDAFEVLPGRSAGHLRLQQSAWYSRTSSWSRTAQYQSTSLDATGSLECLVHRSESVAFPPCAFGLGLGAIGTDWEDCSTRLGEFLAVAGCVAYFPTDGARLPDYVVAAPDASPTAVIGSGFSCRGALARLIRFAEQPDAGAVSLSELASICLQTSGAELAGVVIAAETSGLCGARVRRSPGDGPVPFDLPHVREWISYAPHRSGTVSTALLAGIVGRTSAEPLAALLRPLGDDISGHIHAAAFSYTPLPQRTVDLPDLVHGIFANQELQDVLHLIRDDRSAGDIRESAFVRGVAWVSPIVHVGWSQ